jgi:hypothetical protein
MDELTDERALYLERAIEEQKEALLRTMEGRLKTARRQLEKSELAMARMRVDGGIHLAAAAEQAREVREVLNDRLLREMEGSTALWQAAQDASSACSYAYLASGKQRRDERQKREEERSLESAERAVERLRATWRKMLGQAEQALINEAGAVEQWKAGGELPSGLLQRDGQVQAEMEGLRQLEKMLLEHRAEMGMGEVEV